MYGALMGVGMGGVGGGVDFLQFSTGGSYFLGIRWSDQYSFPAIY